MFTVKKTKSKNNCILVPVSNNKDIAKIPTDFNSGRPKVIW